MFGRPVQALVFPAGLALLFTALLNKFPQSASAYWPWALLFFAVTGIAMNLIYYFKRKDQDLPQLVLVCIVVRLILSLVFLVIFAFFDRTALLSFSLHFILYFFTFMAFEVWFLRDLLRKRSNTKT